MRVLVTGGAGYIGSVITDQLIAAGHRVVVYDNLSKGHADSVNDKAVFVEGDLLDETLLASTLSTHGVDAVVHMAASSLVGESMVRPELYYLNNVIASLRLLHAMLGANIKTIVFSSTAATYGEPTRVPIEEDDPTVPTNPYGESKLAIEHAFRWFHGAHGLKYVSLRYFNAAGATDRRGERHDPETHLIPLVLRAARSSRNPVTVFGRDYPTRDGTCVRDYIHVSDLADAHVRALAALADGRLETAVFNLGCGEGFTVQEVIDAARRVTGREIAVVDGPRRPGDPAVLVAASRRIHEALGWAPRHSTLDEIVRSAWRWEEADSSARDAYPDTPSVKTTGGDAR